MRNNSQQARVAKLLLLVLGCCCLCTSVFAQKDALQPVVAGLEKYRSEVMQEKLFLHLDRPAYVSGETMWFKLYNLDGTLHRPQGLSKIAYVELLNEKNQPVVQGKIALKDGEGAGSFVLPYTVNSGNYKVRAYTNWMKNFSPDLYFEQPVTIVNTFKNLGLTSNSDSASVAFQFFPEGGNLVQGLPSKVAFKAVDTHSGKGVACEGEIVDEEGQVASRFKTHQFGMGTFTFTPTPGKRYTAVVTSTPHGNITKQVLPTAQAQGYTMQLEDASATELKLTIRSNGEQAEQVSVLGHARQLISVAEGKTLNKGIATFLIQKETLAEGITHFTVFNSSRKPVGERLYFKRPLSTLAIAAKADKNVYGTRNKVTLSLQTTAAAAATSATLSLAVYRLDHLPATATPSDISSYVWLSSELKGTVEQPTYYLTETGPEVAEAADNLMLTHGWSRFTWSDVLNEEKRSFAFAPEYNGHLVKGKVTHKVTDGPAPGITAYLGTPSRNVRHYNATSAPDGTIQFEVKDFFGPKELVVQTNTLQDSSYLLQVFSPFSDKFSQQKLPAFAVTEQQQPDLLQRHLDVQVQQAYFEDKQHVFRAAGVDSAAFYGAPDEQYFLDAYTRFKQLEEVLHEYVTAVRARKRRGGYHLTVLDRPGNTIFADNPLVLVDGVPVFDMNKAMAIDPLKIQKLEVVTKKYYHGPQVYKGIVSLSTYKRDLGGFQLDPRSLLLEYEGQQLQREFYAPAYASEQEQQSRLADRRNLLHWAPAMRTAANGKAEITFYTSDVAGTYMVVIQGVSPTGLVGSKVFPFDVKQPL